MTRVTSIKHLVPDRVRPSFVIFDIRALMLSSECSDVKNYKCRLNPVWRRMLKRFKCFNGLDSCWGKCESRLVPDLAVSGCLHAVCL